MGDRAERGRLDEVIAVVGLGYVGLPLALALSHHYEVIGFDVRRDRIAAYRDRRDPSKEVMAAAFTDATVDFTDDPTQLGRATAMIIAVPTPIDDTRRPGLTELHSATELVGTYLRPGGIVVFESTVYPGLTEDVCGPALERASGLVCGRDFKLAYSPERINPGDVEHSLASVVKIVSGQDEDALDRVDAIYQRIVEAGTFRASSIRVAEAAKVLENTQRDLNIALMNELALIFDRAGINTNEVIDAAATKWNFADYRPGLVGGHCIGVDPYYLTYLAEKLDYHPDVILAGRRVNDQMGHFVGHVAVKELIAVGKNVARSRVALLGVTFKENVADIRNSRVVEIVAELENHGVEVVICDPHADPSEVEQQYGRPLSTLEGLGELDGIICAVRHQEYAGLDLGAMREMCGTTPVLLDVRGLFDQAMVIDAGFRYWCL